MTQNVPTLTGKWFKQREKLLVAHIKALVIPGPRQTAERKLEELNWNGKVIGAIILELANDNRSEENGQFGLHGIIANAPINAPSQPRRSGRGPTRPFQYPLNCRQEISSTSWRADLRIPR